MNETLATEMMAELKASGKRWFIAFLTVTVLWFATIGGFLWYLNTPDESMAVELRSDEGNANYVGNDMNGVINNGSNGKSNND
ncbi:MAG: hypothetical protein J1F01_05595 [Oscillospiraceae bacterium]|nr:hypothetical protein [Oscillospiraceae bacterium]